MNQTAKKIKPDICWVCRGLGYMKCSQGCCRHRCYACEGTGKQSQR